MPPLANGRVSHVFEGVCTHLSLRRLLFTSSTAAATAASSATPPTVQPTMMPTVWADVPLSLPGALLLPAAAGAGGGKVQRWVMLAGTGVCGRTSSELPLTPHAV